MLYSHCQLSLISPSPSLPGNYEEGFGKERHKNKWNGPNSKIEVTAGGQTVAVKDTSVAVAAVVEEQAGNGPL